MKKSTSSLSGTLLAMAAAAMMAATTTSCLGDGDNTWATSYGTTDYVYANTLSTSLIISVSSDWTIYKTETTSWLDFSPTSGTGPYYGYVTLSLSKNETGSIRYCVYKITCEDEASGSSNIAQCATRGDGSLGTAPLVSKIEGTDGSVVDITYNSYYDRPSSITISKNDEELLSWWFSYNSSDTTFQVMSDQSIVAYGTYDSGWCPSDLDGSNTYEFSYNSTYLSSASTMIVEHTEADGSYATHTAYIGGISEIDSEIIHNKMEYQEYDASEGESFDSEMLSIYIGESEDYYVSNQNQSVDVNQLIFGIEKCDPLMLLGMYRWARSGYIYSTATGSGDPYTFTPLLNSDGSVSTLEITDPDGESITYTFTY